MKEERKFGAASQRNGITDRARAAVCQLQDAGILFAITSGRPPLSMKMIIDALK
ncbi:HAD hydrolase family protein [Nostoc sp.]|uniref:HAD hydrolase family protein n=1 Tax=Nostoc sp. TaxID=1180 RepID=UPI003FA5AAD6